MLITIKGTFFHTFSLPSFPEGPSFNETFSLLLKKTFTGNRMRVLSLKGVWNGSFIEAKVAVFPEQHL